MSRAIPNRAPLTVAPNQPVLSKAPDITSAIERPSGPTKRELVEAAAPNPLPGDMPTGAVAIHLPEPPKPPRVVAKAPRQIDPSFICPVCVQRRTIHGCLCKLLAQPPSDAR
jgi:hypothetical protein